PSPMANSGGQLIQFDQSPLAYLQALNHNPLDMGDNLPTPLNPTINGTPQSMAQTWWGFPTWRETLSPSWNDPTLQVTVGTGTAVNPQPQPPVGLDYASLSISTGTLLNPGTDKNLLPPMAMPSNFIGDFSVFRRSEQLFSP